MLDPTRRFPDAPPRREPIFNIPPAILVVLTALVIIHAARQVIPDRWDEQILLRLSFLPGTFTNAVNPSSVMDTLRRLAETGDAGLRQAQLGRYILMSVGIEPWTLFTYGLLHADWAHIGLNALWLLAFGSPVAWRLGGLRFGLFLVATTVAGALAHYVTHPFDFQPVIGASAAVSGCMGAALRFMFQPRVPVSAIIGLSGQNRAGAFHQPLLSLAAMVRDKRAMAFLVAWFVANLVFGLGVLALGSTDATIAWQAHIGGFVLGLLALPLFGQGAPKPLPEEDEGIIDEDPSAAPIDHDGPPALQSRAERIMVSEPIERCREKTASTRGRRP